MNGVDFATAGQALDDAGNQPLDAATGDMALGDFAFAPNTHRGDTNHLQDTISGTDYHCHEVLSPEPYEGQVNGDGYGYPLPSPRVMTPAARQALHRSRQHYPAMTHLSHLRSAPRFTLGRGPRFRQGSYPHHAVRAGALIYNPGDPNCTSKMSRSPRFGFGSSRTGRLDGGKQVSPGPGAYSHKDYIGEKVLANGSPASPLRDQNRSLSPGVSRGDVSGADGSPRTPARKISGGSFLGSPGDISTTDTRRGRMGFGSSSSARADSVRTSLGSTSASVQKAPSSLQTVVVSILQASGLQHLNFVGDHMWCQCEVLHGERKATPPVVQTNTVDKTLDPVWNETFNVNNWSVGEALEFAINDKGIFGSKVEGKVVLPSEYFYPDGFDGELSVEGLDQATLWIRIAPMAANKADGRHWPSRPSSFASPLIYDPAPPTATSKMTTSPRYGFGTGTTHRLDMDKEGTPGPGSYAHKDVMCDKSQALLGSPRRRSKEFERASSAHFHSYSPCSPDITSRMHRGPASRFGTSTTGRLDTARQSVPGPGSYAHKDAVGVDKVAGKFGKGTSRPSSANARQLSPNFHSYFSTDPCIHKMKSGPCFGFGTSSTRRLEESGKLTPGPGDYGGHFTQFIA